MIRVWATLLFASVGTCILPSNLSAQTERGSARQLTDQLVARERSALDLWIHADPRGYLKLYAADISYFDPQREHRIDGLDAIQAMVAPLKNIKLPFSDPRYEILQPRVQRSGDVAVLTFQLVNYGRLPNQTAESALSRWNATEVYQLQRGDWRIIHSHWSFTKPRIQSQAVSQQPGNGAEDSVRHAELERKQALLTADTVLLSRLTAPEFYEVNRVGRLRARSDNMQEIATGTLKLLTVNYDSLSVRVYGDVAILTGIADNTGEFRGIPFAGKIRYTRIFTRRDGRWQAVAMQHTPMQ